MNITLDEEAARLSASNYDLDKTSEIWIDYCHINIISNNYFLDHGRLVFTSGYV